MGVIDIYQSVQFSRSVVSDSVTLWTAAHQTSLSFTISQSLLKLMSIKSVVPSNHLILCLLSLIFPNIRVFSNEFFTSSGQSIGASASATVHPMNSQGWFPLGLTHLISLQSKEFSRVFSSTTIRQHQFFSTQLSLWINFHIHTWLLGKNHSFDYLNLCWQTDISAF